MQVSGWFSSWQGYLTARVTKKGDFKGLVDSLAPEEKLGVQGTLTASKDGV